MNVTHTANSKEDKKLLGKMKGYFKKKYPEVREVGQNRSTAGLNYTQEGYHPTRERDIPGSIMRDENKLIGVGMNAQKVSDLDYKNAQIHVQSGLRERPSVYAHEWGHHEFDSSGSKRKQIIDKHLHGDDVLKSHKARFLNEANASRNAMKNAENLGASKEQLETMRKELNETLETYRTPEMKQHLSESWGKGLFSDYQIK